METVLSKREMIVDVRGKLDAMFEKLMHDGRRLLDSGQNFRDSKVALDEKLVGVSPDDVSDEIHDFHMATVEMSRHLERISQLIDEYEAGTEAVLIGARRLSAGPSHGNQEKT